VVLGDTVNSRAIGPLAAGCDVISHEATFAKGMEPKARIAQHSTGWMAGAFAHAVAARHLVLTHFSSRYGDERIRVSAVGIRA
jgi:ribonuclease Z